MTELEGKREMLILKRKITTPTQISLNLNVMTKNTILMKNYIIMIINYYAHYESVIFIFVTNLSNKLIKLFQYFNFR